jgi:hypothetical protein
LETLKIGGQIINTVKCVDDLVLLAKGEMVLQDMIGKLTEIGTCYRMEMNVEKTKVVRILRQPFPGKLMIVQKQLENVESFKYLGSMLTNDVQCNCEIKPLKTKLRPLYLNTQSVPRCKHFSSRLYKPISLFCIGHKSLFVLR